MAAAGGSSSPFYLFTFFNLFFVFLLLGVSDVTGRRGAEPSGRQLSIELNPGSSSSPPGGDLLLISSVGSNDSLHYLWSSFGSPSLLLVHTHSSNSTVQVNWPQFLARNTSGSLRVEPESSVAFSTALVFSRLLEYDDVNDTATPSTDFLSSYLLEDFSWSRLNRSNPALLCGAAANGTLCLQLAVFDSEGRGSDWPHLLHTANSSQLEVRLQDFTPQSPHSRFLLELESVGGANPLDRVDVLQSINDEATPSVFKVSQWVSSVDSSGLGGFVQWKPVALQRPRPSLEDVTPCRHSEPRPLSGEGVAASSALIRSFFSSPRSAGLNVSFGLAGDPFFNSTRFLSWTLLVGVGSPPVEVFSPLVIIVMATGLGMPVLIMLVGGVYVCLRKRGGASLPPYQSIN